MINLTETQLNPNSIAYDLQKIRETRPLIHNITNFVSMQQIANILLACGASPIMAHAEDELAELIQMAHALIINIGTLDNQWLNLMCEAVRLAKSQQIPIILDPVGAGATYFRTQACWKIIEAAMPTVIRGNASEILALCDKPAKTQGVENRNTTEEACEAAILLTQQYPFVITISGATDITLNHSEKIQTSTGNSLLTKITGMGCSATALIGAFCAVNKNYFLASAHAMAIMGIAADIAISNSTGPGSFQMHLLDAFYNLTSADISQHLQ